MEQDKTARIKELDKINKKHDKQLKELKNLLEDGRSSQKAIHDTINMMIVRTETQWAFLRGLGRFLTDQKKGKKS